MNILYIDLLSPNGHKWGNKMQLEGIKKTGANINVISSDDTAYYYENLGYVVPIKTPSCLVRKKNPTIFRLCVVVLQFWLYLKVSWNNYDAVVFSSYDSMIFWLMPLPKIRIFVLDHLTAQETLNSTKLSFIKLINKRVCHLAFNDYIKQRFIDCNIHNVEIMPHGFECFTKKLNPKNKYIFCPSASSVDYKYVNSLIKSDVFLKYLESNNIRLVLKGKYEPVDNQYVEIITKHLTDEEYSITLKGAFCILIPYDDSFNYRVSGIMFESIAYNIKCLIANSPNFTHYQNHFKYNPFFDKTVDSLITAISSIIPLDTDDNYTETENLMPFYYWQKILS